MRGKRRRNPPPPWPQRNIPAYAGKTRVQLALGDDFQEHPRVCGENTGPKATATPLLGTSPRMRGKLRLIVIRISPRRNIPSYAGKTPHPKRNPKPPQEHPRVCGENSAQIVQDAEQGGTSPRMRGKRGQRTTTTTKGRNIPAYAGKTKWGQNQHQRYKEHPRVCGENTVSFEVAS